MTSIKEKAQAYEPRQIKNIADLDKISVDLDVLEDNEAEFPYLYALIEGERHKVPVTVLSALKDILAENSELKSFKVKKTGEGLKTKYTVIPLA